MLLRRRLIELDVFDEGSTGVLALCLWMSRRVSILSMSQGAFKLPEQILSLLMPLQCPPNS